MIRKPNSSPLVSALLSIAALAFAGASHGATSVTATNNPCLADSQGDCVVVVSFQADPHPDPSLTKVQLWRDDGEALRRTSKCVDADGTTVGTRTTNMSLDFPARTFRGIYASGCSSDDEADFRHEAGSIAVRAVAQGATLLEPEDADCLAPGVQTCLTNLVWLHDGPEDCVELWRTSLKNGVYKKLRCTESGVGDSKTIYVDGDRTYALYPYSKGGAASCDAACTGLGNSTTLPTATPLAETSSTVIRPFYAIAFQSWNKDFLAEIDPTCPNDDPSGGCDSTVGTWEELAELATYTKIPATKLELSAVRRVDWPVVSDQQIDQLARFVSDADANGLQMVINLGTQCWVAGRHERPVLRRQLNGDTFLGEFKNDAQFFWTVPYCPDDNFDRATDWYDDTFSRLAARLADPMGNPAYGLDIADVVRFLAMDGNWRAALTPEIRLNSDDEYLEESKSYLANVVPAVRSALKPLGVRVGIQARGYNNIPGEEWQFFGELREAMSLDDLDYIAMSSVPEFADPMAGPSYFEEAVWQHLGRTGIEKFVLSDFGIDDIDVPSVQVQGLQDQVDLVNEFGFLGWWYWTYREYPELPDQGLRNFTDPEDRDYEDDGDLSTDSTDASEYCANWREDLVNVLRTDLGATAPSCP